VTGINAFAYFRRMISFVRGAFVHKTPSNVVVDVNGVGYELHISLNTYSAISALDRGQLHTYFLVREDAQQLFGFFDEEEKYIFVQLISVSGIGASTARMMISAMKPDEIIKAITQSNASQLERIKGIGKKSAERIILELKDKLMRQPVDLNNAVLKSNTLQLDALNALIALGIAKPVAEQAVQRVIKAEPESSQIEDIIKKALKIL
jgi:holliday junction DNA helicase RuvA